MKRMMAFLLAICMMLSAAALATGTANVLPALDLTDCIGMKNDDYRAYLEENGRFNPRVMTESADVTDDEGQTWPAVYRLVISDNGLIVHGLSVGDAFSLDANLLTDNGWAEISREYDGDFSFVYEKVVGEATYRLAVQTLNMNVSSLDYSVDNLEAHLANRAAEAMEE